MDRKMVYNIAVCDDEKMFAVQVWEYLKQYADERGLDFHIHLYYDGKDLLGMGI